MHASSAHPAWAHTVKTCFPCNDAHNKTIFRWHRSFQTVKYPSHLHFTSHFLSKSTMVIPDKPHYIMPNVYATRMPMAIKAKHEHAFRWLRSFQTAEHTINFFFPRWFRSLSKQPITQPHNHFKIRLKFSYEIEDLRILTEYFNSIWWSYVYWYFKLKNKIDKVKYNKKRPCHVSTGQSQTHTHKLTNIYKYSHIHTITRTITSTHTRANTSTHK